MVGLCDCKGITTTPATSELKGSHPPSKAAASQHCPGHLSKPLAQVLMEAQGGKARRTGWRQLRAARQRGRTGECGEVKLDAP